MAGQIVGQEEKKKLKTIIFPFEESGDQTILFSFLKTNESESKSGKPRFSNVLKFTTPLIAIETKYMETGTIKRPINIMRFLVIGLIKIQK
jgi:hypothetical protein